MIRLSLSQVPSPRLLFRGAPRGEGTFSLTCHSIHPPRHPRLVETGKKEKKKSGFCTNLRKCFKPSSHTCDLWDVTRLCSIVIKKLEVLGEGGHEGTLLFSQAIVSRIRGECTFPVPGLAGIGRILMVLLGAMYENCFCLPFEMKQFSLLAAHWFHPLPISFQCPSDLLVLQPVDLKWHPASPIRRHRTPGSGPTSSLQPGDRDNKRQGNRGLPTGEPRLREPLVALQHPHLGTQGDT